MSLKIRNLTLAVTAVMALIVVPSYMSQAVGVVSAQDVKTNPQDKVGGINEVNQLFQGENLGQQSTPEQGSRVNWLLILGIAAGVLALIFAAFYILKNRDEEEDKS